MKFRRVLLKLSGEVLSGKSGSGIDVASLEIVAGEIEPLVKSGVQLAVVTGAGNLWRGAGKSLNRVAADHMGMLATVMNAIALCDALRSRGIRAVVLSAFELGGIAERFTRDRAVRELDGGSVVICAGGTGNPFFTTDTTAALRASEISADVVLKATQVDGVYSADPKKDPDAKRFTELRFDDALKHDLKIMDAAAFALCRDNGINIIVFDFHVPGNTARVMENTQTGTLVHK